MLNDPESRLPPAGVAADTEPAGVPPSASLTVEPETVGAVPLLPECRLQEDEVVGAGPSADAYDRLRLPAEEELPEESAVPSRASGAEKQVRGRILVMESDVAVANLIVNLLEEAQYEIELAMDAKFGLMLADSFNPELILLDMKLPGLSGADMKQILRAAPNFAGRFVDVPILYLGGQEHIVKQRFHASPETPMTRYVMKPINEQELRDKVARAFAELQQKLAAQED
jgi:two-component system response regulator (stage 0 sporulation protein F)